jgi:ABC-type proline/glycine betaine transport system ATPase subunit
MGLFSSKTRFIQKKPGYEHLDKMNEHIQQKQPQYIQERPTNELVREYQEKHPSAIQRWQQRRQQQKQKQTKMKDTLRTEYQQAYMQSAKKAVRHKAHKEAYQKYGATPKQKQQNIGNMFNQIGDIFGTAPKRQPQQQHRKKTKKHQKRTQTRSSDPFDTSMFEDIGDIF